MKVALVYDRVNKLGGAERVLLALHEIWPEAPLYTSVYNLQTAPWAKVFKVIPSFLQKFPSARENHEIYAPFMPMAFENFNFDDYEMVISVTSEAAKGIVTKPKTLHLCYCLTPTRYLWSGYHEYFDSERKRRLNRYFVTYLRMWDKIAANRPDFFIAISKTVQARIKNYYHRESEVVYPPVNTEVFKRKTQNARLQTTCNVGQAKRKTITQNSNFYLMVARLVKYKKVDLVIEAFNQLGWNLKIVGVGREIRELREKAKKNIEFLGQLTDEELLFYYQNCQAVIFPQEEDFGIVAVEVQACGRPVIAFRGGGAEETIIDQKTGLFFGQQTVEDLVRVLREFEGYEGRIKPEDCRKQSERFNKDRFKIEFEKLVKEKWQKHLKNISMP